MLPLILLACTSYQAVGGGELTVQVQGLEDPSYQQSWTIPGATENLPNYGFTYPDLDMDCQGAFEAWLFQIDDESEQVSACGEGLRLAITLPCCERHVYGVDRALQKAGTALWLMLDERGELTNHDSPFGVLHETDRYSGSLSTPSALIYGDTGDTGHPGNTEHISVEVNWEFSPPTRVVVERELGW
jgi:hypothetical protein